MKYKLLIKKLKELLQEENNTIYPFHTRAYLETVNRSKAEIKVELHKLDDKV